MYKIDFNKPEHIHFIGIGGISMSGLAEILLGAGFSISGSDMKPSALTNQLESKVAKVFYGQCAENISAEYNCVVYTAAIHADNPEFARCVELKRNVVIEDEFDTGARMKLNLGHTIGHGVEAKSQFAISHGQAVAIGIAIVSRAALCQDCQRILTLLWQFSLPIHTDYTAEDLYIHALSDKKRSGNTVNLIIPHGIGNCAITPMNVNQIKSFIEAGL